jgi:hypothetical protein
MKQRRNLRQSRGRRATSRAVARHSEKARADPRKARSTSTCPALPGCVSQGRTRVEAHANIREAITAYLRSLRKHGEAVPPGIEEGVVEIAG